jgi:hypothetical protein
VARGQDSDGWTFVQFWPLLGIPLAVAGISIWIHDPQDWSGKTFTFLGVAVYLVGMALAIRRKRRRGVEASQQHPNP